MTRENQLKVMIVFNTIELAAKKIKRFLQLTISYNLPESLPLQEKSETITVMAEK